MSAPREFPGTLLVAVDFSPPSRRALDSALAWRRPESDVIVLHVVDVDLAQRMEATGVCSQAEAIRRMRERAGPELDRLRAEYPEGAFETMLVEGVPFIEIPKLSTDLDCDLIVLGTHGGSPTVRELVFGSTAQRVLLTARKPVLCLS